MFPIHHEAKDDGQLIFVQGETQGWRPTMEDSILLEKIKGLRGEEEDDLIGIFDGHGGYLVSMFCKIVFKKVMIFNM